MAEGLPELIDRHVPDGERGQDRLVGRVRFREAWQALKQPRSPHPSTAPFTPRAKPGLAEHAACDQCLCVAVLCQLQGQGQSSRAVIHALAHITGRCIGRQKALHGIYEATALAESGDRVQDGDQGQMRRARRWYGGHCGSGFFSRHPAPPLSIPQPAETPVVERFLSPLPPRALIT